MFFVVFQRFFFCTGFSSFFLAPSQVCFVFSSASENNTEKVQCARLSGALLQIHVQQQKSEKERL